MLEQALAWRGLAHYLSVAAPPWGVRPRRRQVYDLIFRESGIGWLGVRTGDEYARAMVEEMVAPRIARTALVASWRTVLTEAHKTYAEAGQAGGGGFLTAWRASCDRVAAWVGRNPGASMKEMMTELGRLHYGVLGLGAGANVILPERKVSLGFKYFKEFHAVSTVEGYSLQISGAITF